MEPYDGEYEWTDEGRAGIERLLRQPGPGAELAREMPTAWISKGPEQPNPGVYQLGDLLVIRTEGDERRWPWRVIKKADGSSYSVSWHRLRTIIATSDTKLLVLVPFGGGALSPSVCFYGLEHVGTGAAKVIVELTRGAVAPAVLEVNGSKVVLNHEQCRALGARLSWLGTVKETRE